MMTNRANGMYTSVDKLIQDTSMGRPHIIILGAGASRQTCSEGDWNGRKLPLMNDFIETIGLESIFKEYGIDYEGKNFEDIYSDLYESQCEDLTEKIEAIVIDYFRSLKLPPYPTIYDHLVLSLRKKDLIATFNWDPLLYLACWRNHKYAKLPYVCYLHGNVIIGYCVNDMQSGMVGERCPKCGNEYMRSKILFPVKKKDYNADPAIQTEWKALTDVLRHAYCLTIFGYSAPKSDVEAIEMMKKAWGSVWDRNIEEVEIIDGKNSNELKESWSDFIHTHHYHTTDDFYKSIIALFPRRTCEAQWNYSMPAKPVFYPQNPIPRQLNFPELWEWYARLTEFEK
jgi:hypothetical protein